MSAILLEIKDQIGFLTMNRAEVHNAFDAALIKALTGQIDALSRDAALRVLVLTGAGSSFSAGADLNWMRAQQTATPAENLNDARALAQLMRTLAFCSKPTIALVNGQAFGGGVGLMACCDMVISVDSAKFGLTESKLGLAPAVISPYVIAAMGQRQAMRYFQSAEIFSAERAHELGLVHELCSVDALEATLLRQIKLLKAAGPNALKACKQLVHRVAGRSIESQMLIDEENAQLIAALRTSAEGVEGLSAFLEKRKAGFAG